MLIYDLKKLENEELGKKLKIIAEKGEDIFILYLRFITKYHAAKFLKVIINKNEMSIFIRFNNFNEVIEFDVYCLKIMILKSKLKKYH